MTTNRKTMPKAIKDKILDEYNHRCAICGADKPHIHHIDEESSNNDLLNLLPLCPNCHLNDHHNPTAKVEKFKLQLFRKFKDPMILSPQFHAVYVRMKFLLEVNDGTEPKGLDKKVSELIDFIKELEMGNFYSSKIKKLIGAKAWASVWGTDDESHRRRQKMIEKRAIDFKKTLQQQSNSVCELIIEQLRFQRWEGNTVDRKNSR